MEKIINYLKYIITITIGLLVFVFFKFTRIFLNIRFGLIYSNRIGHLCHNIDVYLCTRKVNEIAFFGVTRKVSNKFVLKIWKKNKNIFFNKIGFYGYFFLKEFLPHDKMLIKWDELYPNYSTFILKKSKFKLNPIKMSDEKISQPYVCFHNRDNAYLKLHGGDGNEHAFRDYDFENYRTSIQYLNKKNIKSVRLGRIVKRKFEFKSENYLDYTNKLSNDYKDVYLLKNCEFFVASATGIANLAATLRKKILLVNTIPFWLREMYQYPKGSIFLPKKIYSKRKKRLLKFYEIENLDYNIHEKNFFRSRNLKVIDNTKKEIYLALIEMLKNYKNPKKEIYRSKLHKKFWGSLQDQKAANIIYNKINLNISDSFLKNNSNLI